MGVTTTSTGARWVGVRGISEHYAWCCDDQILPASEVAVQYPDGCLGVEYFGSETDGACELLYIGELRARLIPIDRYQFEQYWAEMPRRTNPSIEAVIAQRVGFWVGDSRWWAWYRAQRAAADHPPTSRRRQNRLAVAAAVAQPPRYALDGFGCKRGPSWDAWTRMVAARLEEANCRAKPERLTVGDLLKLGRP